MAFLSVYKFERGSGRQKMGYYPAYSGAYSGAAYSGAAYSGAAYSGAYFGAAYSGKTYLLYSEYIETSAGVHMGLLVRHTRAAPVTGGGKEIEVGGGIMEPLPTRSKPVFEPDARICLEGSQ